MHTNSLKAESAQLPAEGYVRLNSVLAVVPVSRSTWRDWVQKGKAPKPVKLPERTTALNADGIHAFIAEISQMMCLPELCRKVSANVTTTLLSCTGGLPWQQIGKFEAYSPNGGENAKFLTKFSPKNFRSGWAFSFLTRSASK